MFAMKVWRPRSAARLPVRGLLSMLVRGDDEGAADLIMAVLAETGTRTSVFADLLHPVQLELGNLWYIGRLTSADEVRVAATMRRIVGRLGPTPTPRPVRPGSRCVIATPQGDPHDVGLMMLMLALQDHGWRVSALAPVCGLGDVANLVVARPPALFCLSAGDLPPLPHVQRAISTIRGARVPVLVGGAAFNRRPDLWRQVGADAHGTDVRIGVTLAQRLTGR